MKYCNDCKYFKYYTTGADEYPGRTCISYCDKGHWDNGDFERHENDMANYCADNVELNLDNIYDER